MLKNNFSSMGKVRWPDTGLYNQLNNVNLNSEITLKNTLLFAYYNSGGILHNDSMLLTPQPSLLWVDLLNYM